MKNNSTQFTIEIWSDIQCPFCYIGKRKLEIALKNFQTKDQIKLEWRSYQLNPNTISQPGLSVYDYLAEIKGQTKEWSIKMHEHVTNMAKEVGLNYHFEKAIIANSYNSHRLIHLAKEYKLSDQAEEHLFKAYFTEGKDIAEKTTLLEIGKEIGLTETKILAVLNSDMYGAEVKADIAEAQTIGVTGVPFFVFNRAYAISGAQDIEVFRETLQKSFSEWNSNFN